MSRGLDPRWGEIAEQALLDAGLPAMDVAALTPKLAERFADDVDAMLEEHDVHQREREESARERWEQRQIDEALGK